jgi:colanic acid biosynthesis glycosyl transferase WcaI
VRLVIYGVNYSPELTGIGKYTGEMAEWLSQQGHDVRVITAPPYYPDWKISKQYSALLYRREIINGVSVWRCPIWVPKQPSGLSRIVHLASFALSSLPIMISQIFWKPNIIMVIEPPLFCAPTAIITSWFCRAHSWMHVQDFEVDAAFNLGIISVPWLQSLVLKLESSLMKRFGSVSTISDQMLLQLIRKGVHSDRQVLFPNWSNNEHIFPLKAPSSYREQLGISVSAIVYLYSGNMGEKQGLEIVVEAARSLADCKNIVFVMCGQGAAYSSLRTLADGLGNMKWLPLQPLEKLNDLLNMADVHLLPQRADAADLVMPSKLTGMLASGRPVLATAFEGTQIAEVLESAGVVVPPDELDLFVNAIINLAENADLRQQLGKNARAYALEYLGRDAILIQFQESLRKCIAV